MKIFFCLLIISLASCYDPARVPILKKQLYSQNVKERADAALELGYLGPPHANAATRDLIQLLKDQNVGVQSAAAYALRRIDNDEARRALERVSK